jgi:A/G-specific adenine glycosylase
MLQQTQVERVEGHYRRFLLRWPTLESLASAGEAEVLAGWSGLGYYARARHLLAAAREALRRHGGLPASLPALAALPGFGRYTAGAVASMAFAIPAPAVDGNAARVLSRLFLVTGDPSARRTAERLWALAEALVPGAAGRGAARPGDFNQALMELGATVCRPAAPACVRCPLRSLCAAHRAGRERGVPRPRRRPSRRPFRLACAVIERRGRLLLWQRPAAGLFGGLWAPPCAEVAAGASPRAALSAAARQGGLRLRVGRRLGAVQRTLTHRDLALEAYRCQGMDPGPSARGRWASWSRLPRLGIPSAMRALLDEVRPRRGGEKRRQVRESP